MPVMSWAKSGLEGGAVGEYTFLSYADNSAVRSRNLDWLQAANQYLYL